MRCILTGLAVAVVCAVASRATAGITVTSHQTVARVNGYAPTSEDQYFARETLTNISPATAHVSGDWTGPNAGGSTPTWNYVGSAQVTSTTTFDPDALTITAAGSFAYELATTAGFVDPSSSTIYSPGAAAPYECFFTLDEPAMYTVSVELRQWGRVFFGSLDTGFIFNEINHSPTPRFVQLSGTIPAGRYQIGLNAGLGAPNLPNGVNHYVASGSYENVIFTVQVPEPNTLGVLVAIIGTSMRRRRRYARAI